MTSPSDTTEATEPPPVLQRLMERRANRDPEVERCEFCSEPIPEDHRHVANITDRNIRCSCRGCSLLFMGGAAAGGKFRTVPDRYLRLTPFVLDPVEWAALQIPVGVVFFVTNSDLGETVAFYPSPGGATESELALDSWQRIVDANPVLADVEPDVEAVLVRTTSRQLGTDGEPTCHVVPVDRCYELIGLLRMYWRGFDGGDQVRQALADFVDDVEARSRAVGTDGDGGHTP